MKDALNRRSRFAKPQPFEHRRDIVIGERDLRIFEALDRHGRMPTSYLFEFVKDNFPGYNGLQNRLTTLYNGFCEHPDHRSKHKDGHECRPVTYLERHPAQWETIHARYQPSVYELTPLAKLLLEENGRGARYARPASPFVHDLFAGCFTASLELQTKALVSRDRIFSHERCPVATRKAPFSIPLDTGDTLIPDDLFGLEFEPRKFRFFALEVDRATERINTTKMMGQSIARKVAAYQQLFETRGYNARYGLPNMSVLFATTSKARMKSMLIYIRQQVPERLHARFLFKVFPTFGQPWRVPRDTLPVVDEWQTVCGMQALNKKAP